MKPNSHNQAWTGISTLRDQLEFRWIAPTIGLLAGAIYVAKQTNQTSWLIVVGAIFPDLSFLTALGTTADTATAIPRRAVRPYNAAHNPALPTLAIAFGIATTTHTITLLGLGTLAHLTGDRIFGYRLRNPDGTIRSQSIRARTKPPGTTR
jgi:Domain of unknown function (DUF4260)